MCWPDSFCRRPVTSHTGFLNMVPETNGMEDPPSQGDEALDFRSSILRTAIAQQCISVGWHSISESSLAALTDVMDRYLRQLSHKIAAFTHYAGRTEAEVGDFRLAINEIQLGVSLKNLRNFCTGLVEEPLMIEIDVVPSEPASSKKNEQEQGPDNLTENGEKTCSSDEVNRAASVRPDWMDDDIIFPPIEPEDNVQETEKVLKEDQRMSASVTDVIIIADDDEEIDEPVSNNSMASNSGRTSPSKAVLSSQTGWPRQLKSVSFVNGTLFHPQDYALPMARMPVTAPKKPKHDTGRIVISKKKKEIIAEPRVEKAITDESAKPAKKSRNSSKFLVESKSPEKPIPNADELKITIRPPKPKKPKIEPQSPVPNTPSTDIPKSVFPMEKPFPKEPEFIPRIPSHPVLSPPVGTVPLPQPKVLLKFKSVPVLINKKDKNVGEKRKGSERTVGAEERKFKEEPSGPRIEKVKRRKVEVETKAPDRERPPKQKKLTDTIDYLHDKHQRTHDNGNLPSTATVSVIVSNRPPQTAPVPPVPTPAPYTPQPKKVKTEERYDPERERVGELERHEARMRQKAEERYQMEQEDLRRKEEQYRLEQDRIMAEKRAKKMEERKARESESLWNNQKDYREPPKSKSGKHKEIVIPEHDSKSARKETAAHPPLPKITLKMGSGKDIQVVKSSNPAPSQPFHAPLTLPRYPPQPLFDNSTSLSLPENLSFNPPVYPSNSSVAAPLDLSMKTPPKRSSLPPAPKPQAAQPPVDQKPTKPVTSQSIPQPKPIKAVLPMVHQPPAQPKKIRDEPVKPLPTPPPPPPPLTEPEAAPPALIDQRVWICPSCGKPDDGSPMVGCDDCDDWFHWTCVGLLSEPTVEQWYCPRCLNRRTSKNSKSKKSRKH